MIYYTYSLSPSPTTKWLIFRNKWWFTMMTMRIYLLHPVTNGGFPWFSITSSIPKTYCDVLHRFLLSSASAEPPGSSGDIATPERVDKGSEPQRRSWDWCSSPQSVAFHGYFMGIFRACSWFFINGCELFWKWILDVFWKWYFHVFSPFCLFEQYWSRAKW